MTFFDASTPAILTTWGSNISTLTYLSTTRSNINNRYNRSHTCSPVAPVAECSWCRLPQGAGRLVQRVRGREKRIERVLHRKKKAKLGEGDGRTMVQLRRGELRRVACNNTGKWTGGNSLATPATSSATSATADSVLLCMPMVAHCLFSSPLASQERRDAACVSRA